MRYSTPEIVLLGSASSLVLGADRGLDDNVATLITEPPAGLALGLDD